MMGRPTLRLPLPLARMAVPCTNRHPPLARMVVLCISHHPPAKMEIMAPTHPPPVRMEILGTIHPPPAKMVTMAPTHLHPTRMAALYITHLRPAKTVVTVVKSPSRTRPRLPLARMVEMFAPLLSTRMGTSDDLPFPTKTTAVAKRNRLSEIAETVKASEVVRQVL